MPFGRWSPSWPRTRASTGTRSAPPASRRIILTARYPDVPGKCAVRRGGSAWGRLRPNDQSLSTRLATWYDLDMLAARIVAVLATLIATQTARAYPGALDQSFGFGGVISGSVLYALPLVASGNRVIVVGAGAGDGSVVRYHDTGALDLSFGVAGVAATAPVVYPSAATLQADGKIVVAGGMRDPTVFTIRRLDADGQPDAGFGPIAVPFRPLVMSSLAD